MGKQSHAWNEIKDYVFKSSPGAAEEWKYSKYGWSYRIKNKKSIIIYLMPCNGFFRVSFVLGKKASEAALAGTISADIRKIISEAKVYAEGRGFRIEVTTPQMVADIKKLIDVKLSAGTMIR